MPIVLAPIPDVAVHLVKSPRIGFEIVDGYGLLPVFALLAGWSVGKVPVVVRLAGRYLVSPPERRRGAGPRHIFAFGLRQQSVRLPGLARRPCHVGLGVLPGHEDRRTSTAAPA